MKRLVFCFDGSWNRIDAPFPTNVLFTAECVLPLSTDRTAQVIFYDEGVGTEKGEELTGGIFGAGLTKNLSDGYRFLMFNYSPGDEIYVFGFSRGAYTARSFVGLLNSVGILSRHRAGMANEAISLYQRRGKDQKYAADAQRFRAENSTLVCVSEEDRRWRYDNNISKDCWYDTSLEIKYLGVWDTVGSLGIPKYLIGANLINAKYEFHDVELSGLVKSARHAVAIDEKKIDFEPTLWDNLAELNRKAGFSVGDLNSPYQQVWFPGVHGGVGGGGDRKGLSDQALDWIWDGALAAGLELDTSSTSRIFQLLPDYREHLANVTNRPAEELKDQMIEGVMEKLPERDRMPGPTSLAQVSVGAKRRWQEPPELLPEKSAYRPVTLNQIASDLDALPLLGLSESPDALSEGSKIYIVKPKDTLRGIAKSELGSAERAGEIFDANRNKLDDPDKIFVGQSLRIPGA